MGSTVILCSILLGVLLTGSRGLPHNERFKEVSIKEFPYFASIEVDGQYACAATIIDDKYVMTTRSCVQGIDVKSLGVRVGTSKQGQRGVFFKVVEVTFWTGNPFIGPSPKVDYDIAMVKVAVSFTYTPHVMWANPNADGIVELQEGSLVSWSDKKNRGTPLKSANAFVMPSSNCSQIYAGVLNLTDDMYCLWPSDPDNTPCFVDMGAPFYLNEQYYGIVTYAPGCDNPDEPIVITGIYKFTSFIITVLCDMANIFGNSLQTAIDPDSSNVQEFLAARQSLLAM